jgi:hypothetical protein
MSTTYRGQGSAHAWTTLNVAEAWSKWGILDMPPRSLSLIGNSTTAKAASAPFSRSSDSEATAPVLVPNQQVLSTSQHNGMIIGVAISGLSTLALLIGFVVLCVARQRKRSRKPLENAATPPSTLPAPLSAGQTPHRSISPGKDASARVSQQGAGRMLKPKELGEDANIQNPSSVGMTSANSPTEILTQIYHQLPTDRELRAAELA